jgi:hypothetical protein
MCLLAAVVACAAQVLQQVSQEEVIKAHVQQMARAHAQAHACTRMHKRTNA